MPEERLRWGKNPQLVFEDLKEYYRALGHLTNSEAYSISYENNKKNGSFSDAFRIHILSKAVNVPLAFKRKETTNGRINCNEYIINLRDSHKFVQSGNVYIRNFDDVLSTVPNEYLSDFLTGYKESSKRKAEKRVCYAIEAIKIEGKSLKKESQPTKVGRNTSPCTTNKKGKRDYIVQYIKDFEIGEVGESLVYEYERSIIEKAKKDGKIDKEISVKWVSREDDYAGYDILSYDVNKKTKKYIEVKTTTGGKNNPFYISENELDFSKTHENDYCIYRVYGLKNENSIVHFYTIEGNLESQENFELIKKDYLVRLKSR